MSNPVSSSFNPLIQYFKDESSDRSRTWFYKRLLNDLRALKITPEKWEKDQEQQKIRSVARELFNTLNKEKPIHEFEFVGQFSIALSELNFDSTAVNGIEKILSDEFNIDCSESDKNNPKDSQEKKFLLKNNMNVIDERIYWKKKLAIHESKFVNDDYSLSVIGKRLAAVFEEWCLQQKDLEKVEEFLKKNKIKENKDLHKVYLRKKFLDQELNYLFKLEDTRVNFLQARQNDREHVSLIDEMVRLEESPPNLDRLNDRDLRDRSVLDLVGEARFAIDPQIIGEENFSKFEILRKIGLFDERHAFAKKDLRPLQYDFVRKFGDHLEGENARNSEEYKKIKNLIRSIKRSEQNGNESKNELLRFIEKMNNRFGPPRTEPTTSRFSRELEGWDRKIARNGSKLAGQDNELDEIREDISKARLGLHGMRERLEELERNENRYSGTSTQKYIAKMRYLRLKKETYTTQLEEGLQREESRLKELYRRNATEQLSSQLVIFQKRFRQFTLTGSMQPEMLRAVERDIAFWWLNRTYFIEAMAIDEDMYRVLASDKRQDIDERRAYKQQLEKKIGETLQWPAL